MCTAVPFYRKKFPRSKYTERCGDPIDLVVEDLPKIRGWIPITEVKRDMWRDSKAIVDQKNKKREFLVTYEENPIQLENGKLQMTIEMLHCDHRGFKYTTEADDTESLCRSFWPVIEALIAHLFSPKLRVPNPMPFSDQDIGEEALRQDVFARYFVDKN